MLKLGGCTICGNTRKDNQDSIYAKSFRVNNQILTIAVVCDGVGGLNYGEYASNYTTNNIKIWWETKAIKNTSAKISYIIKELLVLINQININIIEYSKKINVRMGTTLSLILIKDNKFYTINIGDSRIYRINKKAKIITRDDVTIKTVMKNNKPTKSKKLSQCIGISNKIMFRVSKGKVKCNDYFLICSDGLYNKLETKEINNIIHQFKDSGNLADMSKTLVNIALSRQEKDNISNIIVKI